MGLYEMAILQDCAAMSVGEVSLCRSVCASAGWVFEKFTEGVQRQRRTGQDQVETQQEMMLMCLAELRQSEDRGEGDGV